MSVDYLKVVGIDLGTTFSSIGQFDSRGNVNLLNDKTTQNQWIPSVVSYADSSSGYKVGNLALDDQRKYPQDVIIDAKRMLGHRYDDKIIQELKNKWFFEIEPLNDGSINILTCQGPKSPVQVVRDIIRYLLNIAKENNGNIDITHAVITVPANSNITQRQETEYAAQLAGISCVHLIHEPTSAIIAHWFSNSGDYNSNQSKKTVLTYDFGGGTLDVSLAKVDGNNIEVVASSGEMEVGGRDIDNNLADFYLDKIGKTSLKELAKKVGAAGNKARTKMRKIIDECYHAKITFSNSSKDYSFSPDIEFDDVDDVEIKITSKQFESINKGIIDQLAKPLDRVFNTAKESNLNITKDNLTDIILIGGSSYNKFVIECLLTYFKKMPIRNIDPRDAVAKGAVIEARRKFVDNNSSIPEDKDLKEMKLDDICAISIGPAALGNKMFKLIPKGSKFPITKQMNFVTGKNFSTSETFYIYETEREITTPDCYIGNLKLNVPSKQAEEVKMILQLSLDNNCILHASAWVDGDMEYFTESMIKDRRRFSQSEIDEMIAKAKEMKEQDIKTTNENKLKDSWRLLHENVISFIENFRSGVSDSIKSQFDNIEQIARNKKNESVNTYSEYNSMVDEYTRLFNDYNSTASLLNKTKFLTHTSTY